MNWAAALGANRRATWPKGAHAHWREVFARIPLICSAMKKIVTIDAVIMSGMNFCGLQS